MKFLKNYGLLIIILLLLVACLVVDRWITLTNTQNKNSIDVKFLSSMSDTEAKSIQIEDKVEGIKFTMKFIFSCLVISIICIGILLVLLYKDSENYRGFTLFVAFLMIIISLSISQFNLYKINI